MNNFLDQFRDNLENRPEPMFEERMWKRLEKGLDENDTKPPAPFGWWWILGSACLLLLASNCWTMMELRQMRHQLNTTGIQTDTIYITNQQTIYQRDTIIQTNIIRINEIQPTRPSFTSYLAPSNFTVTEFQQLSYKNELTSATANLAPLSASSFNTNYKLALEAYNKQNRQPSSTINGADGVSQPILDFTEVSNLASLAHGPINDKGFPVGKTSLSLVDNIRKKSALQHLYSMKPKGVQVGISTGGTSVLNNKFTKSVALPLGVNAAIVFSPKLQLFADITRYNSTFETNALNSITPTPTEAPPSDDFVLNNTEASPVFYLYSFGLQYFFNADKKWSPFIGVGYGAGRLNEYGVSYEYEVANQELEWSTNEQVGEQYLGNYYLLKAGFNLRFKKHWHWQLFSSYSNFINEESVLTPRLIDIRTGIGYQF